MEGKCIVIRFRGNESSFCGEVATLIFVASIIGLVWILMPSKNSGKENSGNSRENKRINKSTETD